MQYSTRYTYKNKKKSIFIAARDNKIRICVAVMYGIGFKYHYTGCTHFHKYSLVLFIDMTLLVYIVITHPLKSIQPCTSNVLKII